MLRNLGIRYKLFGLVAVPMVLLLAVSLLLVGQARSDAGKASDVATLARYGLRLNNVVQSLQEERAALSSYIYSDQDATRLLRTQTDGYATDAAIDDLRAATTSSDLALVKSVAAQDRADRRPAGAGRAQAVRRHHRHRHLDLVRHHQDLQRPGAEPEHHPVRRPVHAHRGDRRGARPAGARLQPPAAELR